MTTDDQRMRLELLALYRNLRVSGVPRDRARAKVVNIWERR